MRYANEESVIVADIGNAAEQVFDLALLLALSDDASGGVADVVEGEDIGLSGEGKS